MKISLERGGCVFSAETQETASIRSDTSEIENIITDFQAILHSHFPNVMRNRILRLDRQNEERYSDGQYISSAQSLNQDMWNTVNTIPVLTGNLYPPPEETPQHGITF